MCALIIKNCKRDKSSYLISCQFIFLHCIDYFILIFHIHLHNTFAKRQGNIPTKPDSSQECAWDPANAKGPSVRQAVGFALSLFIPG